MNKAEVIASIASETGMDRKDIKHVIESLFSIIQCAIVAHERVNFGGFGNFTRKKRAKKIARNLNTNTAMVIDEHEVPYFKPSKQFLEKIKSKPTE